MGSKYKGFTLMEMMISMVVISILVAASAPIITQFSMLKTGMNKNVMKCIDNNDSTGWYDTDSAGATILPTTDPCKTAVLDIQNDKNKTLSSTIQTAERGTSAQKIMAKRILRAACDQGGAGACDYFINTCRLNGSAASPYCDDTTDYTDITYYLHLNRITYANNGATYIANQLEVLLAKMVINLLNEVINDDTTAPNANNNIATSLAQPWVYIQACNAGIQDTCEYSYNNNYNRSCYQVKSIWPRAITQTYKLTYDNAGTIQTESINCDMTNEPSAAITGCKNITANLLTNAPDDDCTAGYNNDYNTTCSRITANWSGAPTDSYNLTTNGAPPTALVSATCPPPCVSSGIGTVCADGTVYAGNNSTGYYYYTTPADQGLFTWLTNNNTTATGATSSTDGSGNTAILEGIINPPNAFAPSKAAEVCYNATDAGYSDWYLPAREELSVLYTNRAAIGNFSLLNYYWSSTEYDSTRANIINFQNGNLGTAYSKWNNYNVRCIRQQGAADASCPNPGDTCSDGTKYAGPYSTYYLFTTLLDKGQFTWSNGYAFGSSTMATDIDYGIPNYTKLIALVDDYAPYNAVQACKTLNDSAFGGYTDWYLPARNEESILFNNRLAIGGFALAMYWTSTESNYYQATCLNFNGTGGFSTYDKTNNYRVRCVRRD